MNKANLPYRPCVGMMLINPDNLVFVAHRIDMQVEAWQMPQGGIDAGEDPETAVFREMKEEIGTDDARIIGVTEDWINYDLPDHLIGKVWKGRYRGQRQKWFAMRYTGSDDDIDIETEHPEFDAWRWVAFDALIDLVIPFKRDSYAQVVAEFRHLFEGAEQQ